MNIKKSLSAIILFASVGVTLPALDVTSAQDLNASPGELKSKSSNNTNSGRGRRKAGRRRVRAVSAGDTPKTPAHATSPRVLWLAKNPWKISSSEEKNQHTFDEIFNGVNSLRGTIEFHSLSELAGVKLSDKYDVLILHTKDVKEFAAAEQFINDGKGVLAMAGYFFVSRDGSNRIPYADTASQNFTSKYGITIRQSDAQKEGRRFTPNYVLHGSTHPVGLNIDDVRISWNRGAYITCTVDAAPVLYGSNGEVWAAAWDGRPRGRGRLLTFPDDTMYWGEIIYPRGRDYAKLWAQAISWLAGN